MSYERDSLTREKNGMSPPMLTNPSKGDQILNDFDSFSTMGVSTNPFIAKSGVPPKEFIGREEEIRHFKKALDRAVKDKIQEHFIILGEWGTGKTSLLLEFKRIAQEKGYFCSFVSAAPFRGTRPMDGVRFLIESIPFDLPIPLKELKTFFAAVRAFGVQILDTGITFAKEINRDPQIFLSENLLNIWHDVKGKTDLVVVLIDDAHFLSSIDGIYDLLKAVLSHPRIINETNYLFVLSAIPAVWKPFAHPLHPVGRYFTPRFYLKNLSKEEVERVIFETLEGTGVAFSRE